jgi:hypothetical protein
MSVPISNDLYFVYYYNYYSVVNSNGTIELYQTSNYHLRNGSVYDEKLSMLIMSF